MLDARTPYWVNRLGFLLRRAVAEGFAAQGHDVTAEEWAMLQVVRADPGLTSTALSGKSLRDKTTVTRMIDRLVRKGLVERRADPKDRRALRLFLTRRGYELCEDLARIAGDVAARALDGIAPQDVQAAVAVMARMVDNLKGGPQDGV